MQAFLLDLNHSSTRRHSETDAGVIFLPEPPLDIDDSLHAVRVAGSER